MIDPFRITNYDQSVAQLQESLIFWVFAAGHNANSTAKGVDKLLNKLGSDDDPFSRIRYYVAIQGEEKFIHLVSNCGLGCWRLKSETLMQLAYSGLNLKTCTVDDLELIKGIGPKTSRCFILHSRKDARVAGLDVHILRFLQKAGYGVPSATPSSKKRYKEIEKIFLTLCDEAGKLPAEYDLEIWSRR